MTLLPLSFEAAYILTRLRDMYRIHEHALAWIRYYLSDRLQRVNIKGTLSDKQELNFGFRSRAGFIHNLCLTSSTVLDYCTIHMMTQNSILLLKARLFC